MTQGTRLREINYAIDKAREDIEKHAKKMTETVPELSALVKVLIQKFDKTDSK